MIIRMTIKIICAFDCLDAASQKYIWHHGMRYGISCLHVLCLTLNDVRSVIALPEYRSKLDMQSYVRSMTTILEEDVISVLTEEGGSKKRSTWREMCDSMQQMMDFSLLQHPPFCIYNLACFMCMTGVYTTGRFSTNRTLTFACESVKH